MNPFLLLLLLTIALLGFFGLVYVFARRLDNHGIVDVAWSLCFAPAAALLAALSEGWLPRRLLLAAMIGLWSLRLGLHLWRRVASHHPKEDPRYAALRRDWAGSRLPKMLLFFQAQGLLVALLCAPLLLSFSDPRPGFQALELMAAALGLFAVAGEALADAQLAAFKAGRPARSQVCERGLWAWSRHPNYFFEWLQWVALALFILPAEHGWLALSAPLLMLHFLLRVTGIPYTETQLLLSKGDAYRDYQARTSAFLPLPPRKRRTPSTPAPAPFTRKPDSPAGLGHPS